MSTSAIRARLFPDMAFNSTYHRLYRMQRDGLLKRIYSPDGHIKAWSLTKSGLTYLLPMLPELKEKGYRSEYMAHDLMANAFHLGCWLRDIPKGCELVSEQELRRIDPECLPEWTPRTGRLLHRPDGFWRLASGEIISAEVELNQKSGQFYKNYAIYYRRRRQIADVFWLCKSKRKANSINKLMHLEGTENHSFILIDDFLEKGWAAEFVVGAHVGKKMGSFLLPEPQYLHNSLDVNWILRQKLAFY